MDSTTMVPTNSTLVPFKLLNLTFPVLRNFLDIMPLADLHKLRKNDTIESLSRFRGEIVQELEVYSDTVDDLEQQEQPNSINYSKLMNQPYQTTPIEGLNIIMGSDIIPEVLLSKMDKKYYTDICLDGDYHWRDVVAFLHKDVIFVHLYGNLNLPLGDMKEFFQILLSFKIKLFCFFHDDGDDAWAETAFKVWSEVVGSTHLRPMGIDDIFNSQIIKIRTGDTKMNVYINLKDDEDDDETTDDEEMDWQN